MNPPACLTEEAVAIWHDYGPRLQLKPAAEADFAVFCAAYARWQALMVEATKAGPPVMRHGVNPIVNPHLARADTEAATMRQFLAKYGKTEGPKDGSKEGQGEIPRHVPSLVIESRRTGLLAAFTSEPEHVPTRPRRSAAPVARKRSPGKTVDGGRKAKTAKRRVPKDDQR